MRPNRERYPRPRVIHSYFRYDGSEEPAVAQSNRRRHDQIQNSRGDQAAEDCDRHGAFDLLARLAPAESARSSKPRAVAMAVINTGVKHGPRTEACGPRSHPRTLRGVHSDSGC